jgi:tetratricopeptide (TPR) repeat protein
VAEKTQLSPSHVLRFGVFQANLAARELRKHGVRVRLPGQPFSILSMLLEKPGEVVTREEMQQRLWASDTFVDFEHSLNSAVKKLRAALGDSPENSRYIETIPRLGYRFIAPVEEISASRSTAPQPTRVVVEPATTNVSAASLRPTSPVLLGISAVLVTVAVAYFAWSRVHPHPQQQGNTAGEIPVTVKGRDSGSSNSRSASSPKSAEAYDLYLKGMYFWNKRTTAGFQQAIEYFQQATTVDPNYAAAYAGLANSYTLLTAYSSASSTLYMPQARAAALRSLELDQGSAEAHTALALILQNHDWDWQTSEKEYRRAIELNPNYATAHHWYAEHLMWLGRFDEALAESERARQLDPLSLIVASDHGAILYFSRQYDRAIEQFRDVRRKDPNFSRAGLIVYAYVEKRMFARALGEAELFRHLYGEGPWYWSELAYIHGRAGQLGKARRELEKLEKLSRQEQVNPVTMLWAHLGTGNKEEALADLEKAYSEHFGILTTLKVEPAFDPLRNDPRFQDLLRRAGLADGVQKLSDKDTIVLADFVNKTGDPLFDETLRQALSVELAQSPFLNVALDLQVREMLRRMGRSPSQVLTREIATEVCERMGGKAILVGTISNQGSSYLVGLQAFGCVSSATLAVSQAEAGNKESVLKALGVVTAQVRGKMGESLPSLRKYDFPADATTKSLDALKAFSMGQKALRDSGEGDAIPLFRHAIELDPDFALAYTVLGRAYENVGEDDEAAKNYNRAFQLRDRLSEREKYHITTLYHETVTGDLAQAKAAGEQWVQTYPRDEYAREKLATVYGDLGALEQAHNQAQEALRLDPESTINLFNLVMAAASLNRLGEARQALETARAHGLDGVSIRQTMYSLAFLRGDSAEMERQVTWAIGKATAEELLLSQHSDTEAYYGGLRKAGELSKRAAEAARRDGAKEIAATCGVVAALREIEIGNASLGAPGVPSALSLAPTREVKILAALALARTGDATHARAIIDELERDNPVNTLLRFYWIPTIKASLEIKAGHPQEAASLLKIAAPYELSETSNLTSMWTMYPVYVRGQAYVLAHNARAAALEFNKVLAHPGVVQNGILGALSRLQLARAKAMLGDKDGARKQYQDFLSLWKEADPDVSALKQAKAEYAKLQQ